MLNALKHFGSFVADPNVYPKIRTTHVHLAVTGLSEAGKTVFLTSLINHLKNHKPDRFVLSPTKKPQIKQFDDTQPTNPDPIWQTFPFDEHQAGLASGRRYPARTTACSRYTLTFQSSDSFLTRRRLTLYDIPGHRFADIEMVGRDYASWSDRQLQSLRQAVALARGGLVGNGPGTNDLEAVTRYVEMAADASDQSLQEGQLIAQYKRALLDLHLGLHQYISPSSFLLAESPPLLLEESVRRIEEANPTLSKEDLIEQVVRQRFSGLPQEEFCPLGRAYRNADPALAERFAKRYTQYCQETVLPVFKRLIKCDGLVILLDMATVLAEAPAAVNDTHHFLERLVKALKPGGKVLRYLLSACGLQHRIRSIAVAAAQCDRFHPDDEDQLVEMARALATQKLANIDGRIHSRYFASSAVYSTREIDDSRLCGRLYDGNGTPKQEPEEYVVGRLPEEWQALDEGFPLDFNPGDYSTFPKVAPDVPKVLAAVARHKNLDSIFGFVTGWFLKAGR